MKTVNLKKYAIGCLKKADEVVERQLNGINQPDDCEILLRAVRVILQTPQGESIIVHAKKIMKQVT